MPDQPPGRCDRCKRHAWCKLYHKEGFICDDCARETGATLVRTPVGQLAKREKLR